MRTSPSPAVFAAVLSVCGLVPASAQRQMENLGRGVIAQRTGSSSTYVSWRMLGSDDDDVAFNLYRSVNGDAGVKLNANPLVTTTDYQDNPGSTTLNGSSVGYYVRPVVDGVEKAASATWTLPAGAGVNPYFDVPFTADPGTEGPYDTKFAWVGDFDGDGEYDFLCDRLSTLGASEQFLEAYLRDGTFLWRMRMGPNSVEQYNIEPGSSAISVGHGDNVTCFDLDGDDMAEAIVRTSNGVTLTNAAGATVGGITHGNNNDQFLTVVNGMTGAIIDSAPVPNNWPQHGPMNHKCFIAYLDGKRPSIILFGNNRNGSEEFYYQWTAWDLVNGSLVQRWTWAQNQATHPGAEGHQIRIADVDNDGRDEIVDIGHVVDDDGSQLYVIDVTHGDRFHVADIHPLRPGLETFLIQQTNPTFLATAYVNAATGAFYRKWYAGSLVDVGRGLAVDMDPNHLGMEMFSTQPGIFNAGSQEIFANSVWPYEGLWWDGDTGREFIRGVNGDATTPAVEKFNPASGGNTRLYLNGNNIYNYDVHQAYGGRPAFWGDILGDWREELVLVKNDYSGLRIFSSNTPAQDRRRTLMHNAQYRVQATTKGYVQGSYVDYYLGFETTEDPPPPINDTDHTWVGASPVFDTSVCPNGESILFDLSGNSAAPVALSGPLSPSRLKVFSPNDHTFDGAGGSFTGGMDLLKAGSGTAKLTGAHGFTGPTVVWDGALVIDGTVSSSPVTVHGGTWGGPLAKGETGGRLGGSGTIGRHVTLAWRGAIAPGDGNGDPATLHLDGGLTCGPDTAISFDISNSGTSDRVAIAGDLTMGDSTTFVIHPLDAALAPGTHTLLTYTGTFSGSLADIDVSLPPGTPHSLGNPAGAITLTIPVTRASGTITWKGGANGNAWDLVETANFLNGTTPDVFVSGDSVTFDDSGSPHTNVALDGSLLVGGVTVSSNLDYTFGGNGTLDGSGGLTKSGNGTLTLGDGHGFTGPVHLLGGVVSVTALGDGGAPSSLGAGGTAAANLVLDGATIRLDGPQTSTNRSMHLNAGGGTISTRASSLQLSGSLEGPGALTKTGDGLLLLANANTHAGGTLLDEGTLQLAGDTANVSGLGSGSVTFLGGTLSMTDNRDTSSWHTVNYQLVVPAGETGRLNADGRCYLDGSLTGAGDFTFHTPFVRTSLRADWSGFSGNAFIVADADGGDFRLENSDGFAQARLDFGDGVYAYYNLSMGSNLTIPIGTLSGSATAALLGGPTSGRTLTWLVGARNEDSVFAGSIANSTGPCALTKVGSGTLVLSGACSHSGATTVSGGTLRIDGHSESSDFTIESGGMLGGAGTITGNVTLEAGAAFELAAAPLAIDGDLAVEGTIAIRPVADPGLGTHVIATCTGSLAGNATFVWDSPFSYKAAFSTEGGQLAVTLEPPYRDEDGDLIEDDWELAYYASIHDAGPLDDTDGDGANTWTEWRAGTSPTSDASFPGNPVSASISFEPVADTAVWYRNGDPAYSAANYGGDPDIDNYAYPGVPIIALGYFRFDLSSLPSDASIDGATLTFTKAPTNPAQVPQGGHSDNGDTLSAGRFAAYGLLAADGNTAQDWEELALTGGAAGAEFDFAGAGADPPVDVATRTVDLDGAGEVVNGSTASLSGGALLSFLQGRFASSAPHRGLVTVITDLEDGANGKGYAFASREGPEADRPRLRIEYSVGAPLPDPDEDDDSLADAWEAAHFGTLDSTARDDADGDGSPAWLEQALGLDPTDANERFQAIMAQPEAGVYEVTWRNGPEVGFAVDSSDVPGPPWTEEAAYEGGVSPAVRSHPVLIAPGRRFFRVRAHFDP